MKHPYLHFTTIVVVACGFLPFIVAATSQHQLDPGSWDHQLALYLDVYLISALFFGALVWILYRRFAEPLDRMFLAQREMISSIPVSYIDGAITLAAALSLFLELTMIRWLASVFPFFAFYKNFSLLACFLGLGVGYAMDGRRGVPLVTVPPLLLWQVLLLLYLRHGMAPAYNTMLTSLVPFTEQLHIMLLPSLNPVFFFSSHVFLALV
ncbi:hypothetical protein ACFL2Q_19710, partial [Thermodesulfobacteriota bacterium]